MKEVISTMTVGLVMAGIILLAGKGDATARKAAIAVLVIALLVGVGACLGLS